MTTTQTPAITTTHVAAEDAPIGVQIWPTRSPEFAPNYTLESVTVTHDRTAAGTRSYVTWTYQNGNVRHFALGEQVVISA